MCGIVGAIAKDNIATYLVDGLRRLEYRGYDSAGIAVIEDNGGLKRSRAVGRVEALEKILVDQPLQGKVGLAHTRWATHGGVTEPNAHPHICRDALALVCNGIVENHSSLRRAQHDAGLPFTSDTDTEVVVHQVYLHKVAGLDLAEAVRHTLGELRGSFAFAVMNVDEPDRLVVARQGPPLLIGITDEGFYVASDIAALLPVTREYIVLENGDVADLRRSSFTITNPNGQLVKRKTLHSRQAGDAAELGEYRHYMQKEIHEQPRAVADTLEGRISRDRVLEESFGHRAQELFSKTQAVQIMACGTSFHAGLVAKHWLEYVGIPCNVEIASEYRYRRHPIQPGTLAITISQSGETADTLSALEEAKRQGVLGSLTICNVPESSLVRESDLQFMTHAGPEVGVASTKTFTTAMTGLMLLALILARRHGYDEGFESHVIRQLRALPSALEDALAMEPEIAIVSRHLGDKQHALFLGRGAHYPTALEGALKLKEISYVHAEAYPAGELKHGPLALVDEDMPVIVVAPNDLLLEKLKSNMEEVRARGGRLYVFSDPETEFEPQDGVEIIRVTQSDNSANHGLNRAVDSAIAPILYTVPLQLLAYHVALIKGTDVDKPRNLAKSVTVE
tara:strand:- start:3516 stop:5381 length:1866 start_codon:yes stop_codon:yes gene_type:complete